ncbi:MAG TPA: DUF4920 domain-containing protein [Pyrinomonadaceae bacterium]|nr:DUF4920 domain-containing protein [Pyrinomonadaceae bacterium]
MKKLFILTILSLALAGVSLAQEMGGMKMDEKPDEKAKAMQADITDKTAFPIKRGVLTGKATKVDLAKILSTPEKYSGKTVAVEGVMIRSCKAEGCWMELAPSKEAKSIRIKMKDHAFFIPLNAASQNLKAKAEGVFTVKTLSKAEVDHLIEDGSKFDKRNADGSVTEVSFTASGVELRKATK